MITTKRLVIKPYSDEDQENMIRLLMSENQMIIMNLVFIRTID